MRRSSASLARGFHAHLTPNWNTESPFQWGEVQSIDTTNNTLSLYLDGASGVTPGIPYSSLYTPTVGDVVMVARMQGSSQSARVAMFKLA